MDYRDFWQDLTGRHLGKLVGGILFFLIGILYLKYGLLRTLFLLLLTALGIFIGGRKLDGNQDLQDFLKGIWPIRRSRS
jgi:uncharacterized membrane protein